MLRLLGLYESASKPSKHESLSSLRIFFSDLHHLGLRPTRRPPSLLSLQHRASRRGGRILEVEELLELLHRVVGPVDRVADGARVVVDLVVVAALGCLVAKEVDGSVLDAAGLLGLVLEVRQAEGLVPAGGEDIEGDLAADREAVIRRGEMLLAMLIARRVILRNATAT